MGRASYLRADSTGCRSELCQYTPVRRCVKRSQVGFVSDAANRYVTVPYSNPFVFNAVRNTLGDRKTLYADGFGIIVYPILAAMNRAGEPVGFQEVGCA